MQRRIVALVTLVSLVSAASAQPLANPTVPAVEAWARAFLAAYAARDAARMEAFAGARIAPDMLAALGGTGNAARELLGLYGGIGPLELVRVEQSGGIAAAHFHGTVTGGWLTMHVALADTGAARRLHVRTGERPAGVPAPPAADYAELPAAVDGYLHELARHDLFSGVVAIARGGETVYEGAFGRANRAGDRVTIETRFPLASTTKAFTAATVLTLVRDGILTLDAPVRRYLPHLPPWADDVTIRHLLTHGSGLGTFDLGRVRPMTTIREMLALPVEPPAFRPGTGFRYSNAGYLLLGAVVQEISGKDFFEAVHERVFVPAGMTATGAPELWGEPDGVASGFLRPGLDGGRADALPWRVRRGSPAADFVSTARDLLRFAAVLADGSLLGEELRDEATAPQRPVEAAEGRSLAYGYGLYVETRDGVRSWGHGGGSAGASSSFVHYAEEGWTFVVLSNYDAIGDTVSKRIQEMAGLR